MGSGHYMAKGIQQLLGDTFFVFLKQNVFPQLGIKPGSPAWGAQKENWKYELLTAMYTATGGQTDKRDPRGSGRVQKHPSVHLPPATVESTRFFRCTYTYPPQGLCTCDSLCLDGVFCSLPSWPRCHFINKFLSQPSCLKLKQGDFPGGPVVKTLPSFTFPVLQRIAFGHLV